MELPQVEFENFAASPTLSPYYIDSEGDESSVSEIDIHINHWDESRHSRTCWGHEIRTRSRKIRYELLDHLDISFRFFLAVLTCTSMILYIPEETLRSEFPGSFLIGITAAVVFITPYIGSAITVSLSWGLGSFFAVLLAWITILILGTSTTAVIEEVMLPCGESMSVEGEIGNPSALALGIMVFFFNFLLVYYSDAAMWAKGSTVLYSVYVLLWFEGMKDPLASKLDTYSFFLIARTSSIGLLVGIFFVLIPTPRWTTTPRLVPSPRIAVTIAIDKLRKASTELVGVCGGLNKEYQNNDFHRMQEETVVQYEVTIRVAMDLIEEANSLMSSSGVWEPILTWNSFRYETIVAYSSRLSIFALQLNTIILAFKDRASRSVNMTLSGTASEVTQPDVVDILDRIQQSIAQSIDTINKTGKSKEIFSHQLELDLELLRYALVECFGDWSTTIDLSSQLSVTERENVYHCNCLWKFHNLSKTIIAMNNDFQHLKRVSYIRRCIGWFTSYATFWSSAWKETFHLCRKRKFRTWVFHRQRTFSGSFQIASAALMGSLFVLIDHLRDRFPSGFAIVTTAVLVMDRDTPGSLFAKGEARLSGTALAVGGGFIISSFFPDGTEWGILLLLALFSFVMRFIQCNPKYYYMCLTFSVTIFAILFEISPTPSFINVTGSTNGRAAAATLGVIIASFANVIWPIRSRALIRERIATNIEKQLIPLIQQMFDIYKTSDQPVYDIIPTFTTVKRNLAQQRLLIENAGAEPILWRDPFVAAPFMKVVTDQNLLLINAAGTVKMGNTLRVRAQSYDENSLFHVFPDEEEWGMLYYRMILRLQQIIHAIRTISYVELNAKPLLECYCQWVLFLRTRVTVAPLPPEANVSFWAFVLNCRFVVESIVKLSSTVDELQENIRTNRGEGIPVGLCPVLVRNPTRQKVEALNKMPLI